MLIGFTAFSVKVFLGLAELLLDHLRTDGSRGTRRTEPKRSAAVVHNNVADAGGGIVVQAGEIHGDVHFHETLSR
ncbi:hypothetical protein A8924_1555 [Saccharopolyspora erythraea NRRL 2338]|uniref:Uncharacterized protein n=2 Tax=Saccharopolyspora erythraea TaxID=1836 RepID=A4F8W2_SACEN|nr:hypothetical protein [Saccharopolyspora erythraea]EQD86771.1 hypothetical protein N599_07845 [Saccharopolyspora erythraea D]PFG94284.1 hypothetical protein A8924_1555 [Saccharopolyspora erythraea NRRL 2338]QRK91054.1 hypothetical protein JQX30_06325 [Saccharopolyspora erythraea]CAM00487.1 hypothetical protein SACE_1159 [Saccharopolyspora erythraea NRRL 2338]